MSGPERVDAEVDCKTLDAAAQDHAGAVLRQSQWPSQNAVVDKRTPFGEKH